MVDADAPTRGDENAGALTTVPSSGNAAAIAFEIMPAGTAALEAYRRLCEAALFSPPQSPQWVSAWSSNVAADGVIAFIVVEGAPVFAMALEIVSRGPFRVAGIMGSSHANGNFFPMVGNAAGRVTAAILRDLFAAIAAARPDIDVLTLERQVEAFVGATNPLAALPRTASPNLALAVDLDGGFEAVLSRSSGKRKRKKHRSQIRKFEAAGGYRRWRPSSRAEIASVLDDFFVLKAHRFRRMGISDPFAAPPVRRFFSNLFTDALNHAEPPFHLIALEVGGRLRAVTGMSDTADRVICEFGAIAEDDMASASPGDFLFFENIGEACERGRRVFDFSVGDEPYKRLWCDIESRQFDVVWPLSLKGRMFTAQWKARTHMKRLLKNNRFAWRMIAKLRRHRAEAPANEDS